MFGPLVTSEVYNVYGDCMLHSAVFGVYGEEKGWMQPWALPSCLIISSRGSGSQERLKISCVLRRMDCESSFETNSIIVQAKLLQIYVRYFSHIHLSPEV